jgi:diacylglycerol kinase (ATP)
MKTSATAKGSILKTRSKAFVHAWCGLRTALKLEQPLRIHLFAFCVVTLLGFVLRLNASEWAAIILCSTLVLAAELFNTAIERLCDFIHMENHPGIKYIKDVGAAAVLISSIGALIVGLFVFTHAVQVRGA